jgi:hypothetical protein
MLMRELDRIAHGEDPKGTLRDPARNTRIDIPIERHKNSKADGFATLMRRHAISHSARFDDLVALFGREREPVATGAH